MKFLFLLFSLYSYIYLMLQGLPRQATASFEQLSKVTSSSQNYLYYREALAAKELPFSPNLAVHLRDLTFVSI